MGIDSVSYPVGNLRMGPVSQRTGRLCARQTMASCTDMLVDQDNPDVLAVGREPVKCRLNGCRVRFTVHHQEILLLIRTLRNVLEELK